MPSLAAPAAAAAAWALSHRARADMAQVSGLHSKAIETYNRLLRKQARATHRSAAGGGMGGDDGSQPLSLDGSDREGEEEGSDGGEEMFEPASKAEATTWMQRTLECCRQLGEWEQCHDAVLDSVAPGGDAQVQGGGRELG